ncbi:SCO family protein [Bernardetia sp. Wsw4-3y2]|uniref:SCO family protein n=1 Tax=Bernardetia sp. Wsw4-3y2 TaxID=3127471 RepID=UPI0030CAAE88
MEKLKQIMLSKMEGDMDYLAQKTVKMFQIVFLMLLLGGSLFFISCQNKEKNKQEENTNSTQNINLPYYNTPDFTPIFLDNKAEIDLKIPHKISNFSFLNQDSLLISEKVIEGKTHVANFIFTYCGSICPMMTENMKIVEEQFLDDENVVFLSFSVTPWIDKPHVLKAYTERKEIRNKNWHFLTGDKATIYDLARKSYFAEEDIGFTKDSTEFLHTEHFILVDQNKRIRGIYNGTLPLEMKQLAKDILALKEEDSKQTR